MSQRTTTIFDLYGGPGTGKSTSAALMYAMLKQKGVNSELVREYVKDWAWDGRKINTYDQLYLMGKQIRRESMLYGKVDAIVSDSPVMMGIYYSGRYSPASVAEGVRASTLAFYRQAAEDGHKHVHVFLRRSKPYEPAGRYQTETEAKEIDNHLKDLLQQLQIPYIVCDTTADALNQVLADNGF